MFLTRFVPLFSGFGSSSPGPINVAIGDELRILNDQGDPDKRDDRADNRIRSNSIFVEEPDDRDGK